MRALQLMGGLLKGQGKPLGKSKGREKPLGKKQQRVASKGGPVSRRK